MGVNLALAEDPGAVTSIATVLNAVLGLDYAQVQSAMSGAPADASYAFIVDFVPPEKVAELEALTRAAAYTAAAIALPDEDSDIVGNPRTRAGVAFADCLTGERLRKMIQAVTAIRGIGEWTAHMLLISCFASPDVLPVGDYGVRKGAQRLYDLPDLPKRSQLEALAEPWRPFRSVAAWYLWRVMDDA